MQRAHVVGELALQEGGGVLAAQGDDAELRQIRHNGAVRAGRAFAGGVAIVQHAAAFDYRALGLQKVFPGIDHVTVQSKGEAMKPKSVHADARV
jgi:hypothetical protein